MKLNEFIEQEAKLLTTFERWWHKQAREDKENFPFEMEVQDWAEQLELFETKGEEL